MRRILTRRGHLATKRPALLGAILMGASVVVSGASPQGNPPGNSCAVSQMIRAVAPPEPDVTPGAPQDWFMNADRTIRVAVPSAGWPAGGTVYQGGSAVKGQKTYWVRPAGEELAITGHRIDGQAPAVEAHVPCCYRTGFQIVALFFPTEGCWEVSATSGDRALRFVTAVRPANVAGRP